MEYKGYQIYTVYRKGTGYAARTSAGKVLFKKPEQIERVWARRASDNDTIPECKSLEQVKAFIDLVVSVEENQNEAV